MTDKVMEKWKQKIHNMKKEDYFVLLLIGVLLLIVSLPTERGEPEKDQVGILREESGQEEGNAEKTAGESGGDLVLETGDFNDSTCYSMDSYVAGLEKRAEEIISGMEGAGKVQVMITLADMGTEILERDREITASDLEETDNAGGRRKNTESGQREEVIYRKDADGNETPYVVQRKLPEVAGVVVIAEGAGNTKVKDNIIGAVSVLFNLNEHRIRVIRMKS